MRICYASPFAKKGKRPNKTLATKLLDLLEKNGETEKQFVGERGEDKSDSRTAVTEIIKKYGALSVAN